MIFYEINYLKLYFQLCIKLLVEFSICGNSNLLLLLEKNPSNENQRTNYRNIDFEKRK